MTAFILVKSGGTITGSNSTNGNKVSGGDKSSAVSGGKWDSGSYVSIKRKDTTSGPSDNLSYDGTSGESTGAWDE